MENNNLLNTEQLLLLENLTYLTDEPPMSTLISIEKQEINSGNPEGTELTVGGVIDQFSKVILEDEKNYGSFITGKDWKNILETISKDETLCNMKIVVTQEAETSDSNENASRSCQSVLFVNEDTKEAVVAFRGTGENEWKDNFIGGGRTDAVDGVSTDCQQDALKWYQDLELEKGDYETITVIGHSKGGNKAKYITVMDSSVDRCVSFDGQGFSDEFMSCYEKK